MTYIAPYFRERRCIWSLSLVNILIFPAQPLKGPSEELTQEVAVIEGMHCPGQSVEDSWEGIQITNWSLATLALTARTMGIAYTSFGE